MKTDKQNAFTFIEVVVSMAIILILAAAMLTAGKHLKTRADRQLTQSAIEIIGTALAQYYEQTKRFPPMVSCLTCTDTYSDGTPQSLKTNLSAFSVSVVQPSGWTGNNAADIEFLRSSSAYFFVTRVPESKMIIESLTAQLISATALDNIRVQIDIQMNSSSPKKTYEWVCWVDAWGQMFRYSYAIGDAFPLITSAGPDKTFGTSDDLKSQ